MLTKLLSYMHYFILVYAIGAGYLQWESKKEAYDMEVSRVTSLELNIDKKTKELEELKSYYEDVERAKDKIRIVSQQIKDLQQRLPSKSDDIRNLSFIKDLANKVNLQSVDLKPEKEVMKEFYFLTRYNLNAEGTYLQFLLLLEQIATSQKLLNIPVIDIQLKQENQRGRFILLKGLIVVESYRYNEKYREESGIKDIEKKYNLKR